MGLRKHGVQDASDTAVDTAMRGKVGVWPAFPLVSLFTSSAIRVGKVIPMMVIVYGKGNSICQGNRYLASALFSKALRHNHI